MELLSWFGATHELALTGFGAYWRLAWLPGPGSVGEQDAWLLEGLAVTRGLMQAVLVENLQTPRGDRELTAWRDRVRRDRG